MTITPVIAAAKNHPYLSVEDVNNIVHNAFADKAVAIFIRNVKNCNIYSPHIVEDDIYTTFSNFINNIDTTTILTDFVTSFNIKQLINDVITDEDEQLESQDITFKRGDDVIAPAHNALKSILIAINNKSEVY